MTLTTEQLRARAAALRTDAATLAELGDTESSQRLNESANAFDELAANREAQPVAWSHEWASHITCEGPQNFKPVIEREAPPQWAIDEGQARNVIPLYTAPPAPAVPDCFLELLKHAGGMAMGTDWNSGTAAKYHRTKLCEAVEACRAAMLALPVSSGYKLPDGWIACSEQMPAVGENDWRTALPVLVKCEIGVIPAYYGFTYHEGEQCFGFMESVKFGDASGSGPEQHENRLMMHVTHWMPLPAAPEGGK